MTADQWASPTTAKSRLFSKLPITALTLLTVALTAWPVFDVRSIELTLLDMPILLALIWYGPRQAAALTLFSAVVGWSVWGTDQPNAWLTIYINTLLLITLITLMKQAFEAVSSAACGLGYWVFIGAPLTYLILAIGFGDSEVALALVGQRVFSGVAALIAANALHFLAISNQKLIPTPWLNGRDHIEFSLREVTETAALIGAATPILLLVGFLASEQLEKEIETLLAQSDARFETLVQGASQTMAELDTAAELISASLKPTENVNDAQKLAIESQLKTDLNATEALGFIVFEEGQPIAASPGAQPTLSSAVALSIESSVPTQQVFSLSSDEDGPTLYRFGVRNNTPTQVGIIFPSPLDLWSFMYGQGLSSVANTGAGGGVINRISHFHGPSEHDLFGIDTDATIVREEYSYAIWIPESRKNFVGYHFKTIAQFRNSYITFMASDPLVETFDSDLFDVDCFRFTTDFWTHMRPTLNAMSYWMIGGTAGLFLLSILLGQAINYFVRPFAQLTSAMSKLSKLENSDGGSQFKFNYESGSHEFLTLSEGFSTMEADLQAAAGRLQGMNRSYETLLDQVEVGFLGINADGEKTFQNPVMKNLLGKFDDLLALLMPLKPEDAGSLEPLSVQNNSGSKLNALIHVVPRINLEGKVDGSWVLLTDVTSLRDAEEQAIRAQRLAALGQMATGMAHEINQPLQSIRLSLANLGRTLGKDNSDSTAALEKTSQIDAQVSRISALIQHMKSYGRLDASTWQDFAADSSIDTVINTWKPSYQTQGITIEADLLGPEKSWVSGSGDQFELVILNLLHNARDAYLESNKSGAIHIKSRSISGDYVLTIEDSAGGFDAETSGQLFDPFFTTKAPNKGAGLGLSVSYGIIDDMGGQITAEAVDAGARFIIRLPVVAKI